MSGIDFAKIQAEDAATNPVAQPAPQDVPGDEQPALTEETADTVAAPGEEAPAPTEAEPAEKAKQAKIDERFAALTAKRKAAERENRELKAKLALRDAPEVPASELHPSKFATIEEYDAAVKKHAREEAEAKVATDAFKKKTADFRSRLEKDGKDIEGIDDVISTVMDDDDFPLSPPMAAYLLDDADNPAPLAKWLTDNPDEAKRIAGLRPTAATKELVRRDGLLGRKATPSVTRAPAPTPSVSGSGTAPQTIDRMPLGDVEKLVRQWNRR